ncbi:MAG TPA: hypothetical protein VI282_11445, partial [Verrucomicrobiae bacterium]
MLASVRFLLTHLLCLSIAPTFGADWVEGRFGTNEFVWGSKGGLVFAIPPSGFRAREPRGLIRLGYPVLTNGAYDL